MNPQKNIHYALNGLKKLSSPVERRIIAARYNYTYRGKSHCSPSLMLMDSFTHTPLGKRICCWPWGLLNYDLPKKSGYTQVYQGELPSALKVCCRVSGFLLTSDTPSIGEAVSGRLVHHQIASYCSCNYYCFQAPWTVKKINYVCNAFTAFLFFPALFFPSLLSFLLIIHKSLAN